MTKPRQTPGLPGFFLDFLLENRKNSVRIETWLAILSVRFFV